MTVRDSITCTRARTPGAEDYPTSMAAHDRTVGPTQRGNTETSRSARKADTNRPSASVCREQAKLVGCGKAPLAGMEHYRRSRTHNSRRAWVLAAKHSHDIHR